MLRHPVARLLSSYFFILRRPLHPLHRKLKREKLGVKDLIALTPGSQNLQCRFIAGIGKGGACDRSALEQAKEHLSGSFSVVGISENFQESLLLMATKFGWEIPYYQNRKVAKTRPTIEPELTKTIREYNSLDCELYDFGKELFEADLRQNQDAIAAAKSVMDSRRAPGAVENLFRSGAGMTRFLTSKIASAV
jgi:hypothetical protein